MKNHTADFRESSQNQESRDQGNKDHLITPKFCNQKKKPQEERIKSRIIQIQEGPGGGFFKLFQRLRSPGFLAIIQTTPT